MDIEVLQDDSATSEQTTPAATSRGRVAIAGLGNIGSFTADLLARMPDVKHLTLIDYQSYEASNLASQHIAAAAVGRPKAHVVARRLQAIRSDLHLEPLVMDLRHVPLAKLQVDVLCACLDSRLARLMLNDIALALGVPWVDAGVEPSRLLARVNTYRPGPTEPCYACALSPEDYRHLEVTYPCSRDRAADALPEYLALRWELCEIDSLFSQLAPDQGLCEQLTPHLRPLAPLSQDIPTAQVAPPAANPDRPGSTLVDYWGL